MYVNSRLLKVLEFLKKNNQTSIKEISEKLNITDRVIRYDLDTINFLLRINKLPLIEKKSKGKLAFHKSLIGNQKIEEFYKLNKHSKEERIDLIKAKLLIEGKINLSATSKNLDVSRTSIRNDMNVITEELQDLGIKIIQNCVCEDEQFIRSYIMKTYSKNMMKFYLRDDNNLDENLLDDYFTESFIDVDKNKVKKAIRKLLEETNNKEQNYYDEIWIYTMVSYLRINQGKFIDKVDNEEFLKNSEYYLSINRYLDNIEMILNIMYSQKERLYLIDYLLGILNHNYNVDILENWVDVVLLAKQMIKEVSNYSGVNIQSDEILINGLLNHIKPAINRLKNNITMENDIYMDVIEPYPELFNLIKSLLRPLEDIVNKDIPNSEVALITLHFLASLERNRVEEIEKKKVLLVCGGGYGTSAIVSKQISELYNVEIKEILYYAEFVDYNLEDVDVVVTTLKLNESIHRDKDIPIIKISPFLTIKDQKVLGKHLAKSGLKKSKLYEILDIVNESVELKDLEQLVTRLESALINKPTMKKETIQLRLLDWISEEKIRVVDKIESWQDALRICGEPLIKSKEIKPEYIDEIIEVAENFGVHFLLDNGVAIPHGEVEKNVYKSSISILYSKEPVVFPEGKKAELFLLIAAKTTKDHVKSIEDIISFVSSKEFVDEVKKGNTPSEIYLRLENVFYKYIY
ncbi:BglG family transcription antiterminator [Clostridium sp. LP20]|uniref:BglG family transcription antiterminator n=1 Tax=Clostridium sp. LP20 TaxID=3418665 RepID=UPI003EE54BF0